MEVLNNLEADLWLEFLLIEAMHEEAERPTAPVKPGVAGRPCGGGP